MMKRKLDKMQCTLLAITLLSVITSLVCMYNSFNVEANTIEGLLHKNAVWLRWAYITSIVACLSGFRMYYRICSKKGEF